MPRKYDKKTKANFRAGRRNSRRASMRISMVSPGLSMFDEEFDPSIDDTMLMLKAKGIDRERERFAEALTEVRDRISRIVDEYDAVLDESAYIYKDYIGELQKQASVMPGSKLLHALQENMNAQQSSMREVPTYFDDDDEFDFFASDTYLRNYTKTLHWLTDKFKDMDARVCMIKKRELASKGEKKRLKKEKQKEKEKEKEKAKLAENTEKLDPTNSKERLDTWKYAAEEIVDLLKTIRQEGEGGKDILANELQKIMNIMNKQNEEIEKKTGMVQKEKEATLRMKQNRDKLQVQIGNLETKLKAKQNEVTTCKQYIRDIVKKMKDSPGEVKFSLEGMEEDDLQDENKNLDIRKLISLPTVMRRRFTLTESSLEKDFAEMKLKDSQKKVDDLLEENTKLQEEVTNLGEAILQKEREFAELKTMFSEGDGVSCPKCQRLTGTPGSEDDTIRQQKVKLELLEQKLQESESKLETTVVDLARMRINLASSGIVLPDVVNVSSQTPINDQQMPDEEETDEIDSSRSSFQAEEDGSRSASRGGSDLGEIVITEASPLVQDTAGEPEVSSSQATQRSSNKKKRQKQARKDQSRKQTTRSSVHPDVDMDDATTEGRYTSTKEDSNVDVIESTISLKMNVNMENKAVQTVHGGPSSAYGRSPLQRDGVRSIPGSRAEARERMEDLREEMTSLAGGKMEFETGWRAKLHKLCSNIEHILDDTEIGGQLERILSVATIEGKKEFGDNRHNLHPNEDQFVQNESKRRKSIFMRLVENNNQKGVMPDISPVHDAHGRYNRSRSILAPRYKNIEEEPETSAPNTHLPALPPRHRSKSSKHLLLDTGDVVKTENEISKSTPSEMPIKKAEETHHEENQVSEPGKPKTGILKHTPPKHFDSHPPSHPKDDMKGKVRKQSLTFGGDEDVKTPYNKPFRVRRRSVFGHADVLEKLASSTGLENIGLSGESKYADGVQPYQEDNRYYDSEQSEFLRTVSRGRNNEYGAKDPSTPDRPFDAQQLRYRRMSRGQFRPSMHPFIGLSDEHRQSLTNIYHARQKAGSRLRGRNLDYDDEESEIEVGKLLNDYRRDSLRKAFLSLGLKHLKGDNDDVKADERLTMEDQVNIVAQMAMEVLKATCDVFAKSRRESQSIPNEQLYRTPVSDEEEIENAKDRESIFPPVNSPENRVVFEDEREDSADEKNTEALLLELPTSAAAVEVEIKDPNVSEAKRSSINRSRQGSELRQKDILAKYAAKRRSLNRTNPFRTLHSRKTVMERILGNQMSVFGNILGNENARFAGGMRSHRNSLVRPLVDDEAFTLTAQAIKLPSQSHQTRANPQLFPPVQKPTPQGILKSSSVGTPAHGLSPSGPMKYTQAIAKARSDQTHNRLFIGSRTQEQSRWPGGRMRHPGIRKRM